MTLRRFWLEFDLSAVPNPAPGTLIGCGVTAHSFDQASSLIARKIFDSGPLPPIKRRIDDVDVRTLDQGHVVPNMGVPAAFGIWFPLGYSD